MSVAPFYFYIFIFTYFSSYISQFGSESTGMQFKNSVVMGPGACFLKTLGGSLTQILKSTFPSFVAGEDVTLITF